MGSAETEQLSGNRSWRCQDSCTVAATRADSLESGGDVDQGWPVQHGAKAEADRWADRSEGAQITAGERGVRGDDGGADLGLRPTGATVAGAATGADPRQQPTDSKVQQPTHHGIGASGAGMAHSSQPGMLRRPMANESCRGPGLHHPARARAPSMAGGDLDVVESVGGREEHGQLRGRGAESAVARRVFDHHVGHRAVGDLCQRPITTRYRLSVPRAAIQPVNRSRSLRANHDLARCVGQAGWVGWSSSWMRAASWKSRSVRPPSS